MEQSRIDILEAVAHGDKDFFGSEFASKPEPEIKKWLKKYGLKKAQIESVLKLIRSN